MNLLTEHCTATVLAKSQILQNKIPINFFFFEITNIENLENKEVGFVYYATFLSVINKHLTETVKNRLKIKFLLNAKQKRIHLDKFMLTLKLSNLKAD